MCSLIWKHICPKKTGRHLLFMLAIRSKLQSFISQKMCYVFFVCVCFQALPEFGPGQRERNTPQQPGKVCQVFSLEDIMKRRVQALDLVCVFVVSSSSSRPPFIHRFAYKDEYEKFKLYMTIILMFGAITCLFFLNCRWENFFPLNRYCCWFIKS